MMQHFRWMVGESEECLKSKKDAEVSKDTDEVPNVPRAIPYCK